MPDTYLTYDVEKDQLTLFIPPVDADDVIWSGMPVTEKEALEKCVSITSLVLDLVKLTTNDEPDTTLTPATLRKK